MHGIPKILETYSFPIKEIQITEHTYDMVNQNNLPGVMQFESNLFSVGRVSPDSLAFRSKASASRADLKRFLIF